MKIKYDKRTRLSGIAIIIIAAILMELISLFRYWNSREIMEEGIEKNAFAGLIAASLRIQEVLSQSEEALKCELWHASRHLDDPDYMFLLAQKIVQDKYDNIVGAGMSFKPDYYPSKGRLFQPYAYSLNDSVYVRQAANKDHDYTNKHFFQTTMQGDTIKWSSPYHDENGSDALVTSYVLPIRDKSGTPVGSMGIDLSTHWIGNYVNMYLLNPSTFSIVLTEEGELIAGPEGNKVGPSRMQTIVRLINDTTITKELKFRNRIHSFAFYDDEKKEKGHIYYLRKERAPHWRVVLVCYDKEVFSELDAMQKKMAILMLAGLLLMAFIVLRFIHYLNRLNKAQVAQERIASELSIASNIQQALLPTNIELTQASIADVGVAGRLIPAKEVGGDLYNAFVRDGKLFFCIGDVSGKGVPSALIMTVTQTLFRNIAARENHPAHIMSQLNVAACRNNQSNIFVTLFVGVLDLPTGHLRYCNAGHEVPILILPRENGTEITLLDAKPNLPIGLFEDFKYDMQIIELQPGASMFLYTDGLTEARNQQNKLFGRERVIEMIEKLGNTQPISQTTKRPTSQTTKSLNVRQLVESVVAQVKLFSENTEQSDDLTLLAISYTPTEEQLILDEHLTLHNNVQEVAALSAFVKDVTARLNIAKPLASKLRLALEEAVVNVIDYAYPTVGRSAMPLCSAKNVSERSDYAYPAAGEINIHVTCSAPNDQTTKQLKFVITDSGIPFNPTEVSAADTTLSAEERPVGGLGILLVRKLMDSINYERIDEKNVLTLTKKI